MPCRVFLGFDSITTLLVGEGLFAIVNFQIMVQVKSNWGRYLPPRKSVQRTLEESQYSLQESYSDITLYHYNTRYKVSQRYSYQITRVFSCPTRIRGSHHVSMPASFASRQNDTSSPHIS